jgi:SulP family sulfate permease
LKKDLVAGVPGAIGSVPDGMAAAVLIGVNPIHGLYASMVGPIAGGLTASTRLMVITTTTAAALAAGSALATVPDEDRTEALFLLTVLAGAVMLVAGLLKLGRYTRFVSHSVMIGFLTGVAVNIVLGQFGDLTGVATQGANSLARALSVITNPGAIHLPSLLTGLGAIALLVALSKTKLAPYAAVIALAIPTIALILLGSEVVALVSDSGEIPRGLPVPALPRVGLLSFEIIAGALAVAVIVLVQGAGVAESAPNPDGTRSSSNRDFTAQGISNIVSGIFRGQPVGGSVGQTALNMNAGAVDRWGSIASGVWMLMILVAFSGLVGWVAMPTLAAVLIVAGLGSIRVRDITTIWRAGPQSQVALATTFVSTLFLPVAAAVGVGVAISLLLQVNQEAMDVRLVRLVPTDDGYLEEPVPRYLSSNEIVILDVYGSMFYAGARTLETHLPEVGDARTPVVVLRMRGRRTLGATAFAVLTSYSNRLAEYGGRLYLSGVDAGVLEQFQRFGIVDETGPMVVRAAEPLLGASTRRVMEDARSWLVLQQPSPEESEMVEAGETERQGPGAFDRGRAWFKSLFGERDD